jgi:hypothetical protein
MIGPVTLKMGTLWYSKVLGENFYRFTLTNLEMNSTHLNNDIKMASQLAYIRFDSVKGDTVTGLYESIYERNVGFGCKSIAASFLWDLYEHGYWNAEGKWLDLLQEIEGEEGLESYIKSSLFDKPFQKKTKFVFRVTDESMLEDFKDVKGFEWESYYTLSRM